MKFFEGLAFLISYACSLRLASPDPLVFIKNGDTLTNKRLIRWTSSGAKLDTRCRVACATWDTPPTSVCTATNCVVVDKSFWVVGGQSMTDLNQCVKVQVETGLPPVAGTTSSLKSETAPDYDETKVKSVRFQHRSASLAHQYEGTMWDDQVCDGSVVENFYFGAFHSDLPSQDYYDGCASSKSSDGTDDPKFVYRWTGGLTFWATWTGYSGTAAQIGGDPHVVNMAGQAFDIVREGTFALFHAVATSDKVKQSNLWTLMGTITRMGGQCKQTFLQNLTMTGLWMHSNLEVQATSNLMRIRMNDRDWNVGTTNTSQILSSPHLIAVNVHEELKVFITTAEHWGWSFLNVDVEGLVPEMIKNPKVTLSGLLAYDDYTEVSTAVGNCTNLLDLSNQKQQGGNEHVLVSSLVVHERSSFH